MDIDSDLYDLKNISQYCIEKTANGHYDKCPWSDPKLTDCTDSCVCDTIAMRSFSIRRTLDYLFGRGDCEDRF
ncbi:hypothetical protein O3M35_012840 [Rhynocoris fuscipes]|uniref:Uncharacterized protein n=1 Tax=Rhynocoris fuscipes TaxID=488301 RepID=A0AAW1CEG8_9HEMI